MKDSSFPIEPSTNLQNSASMTSTPISSSKEGLPTFRRDDSQNKLPSNSTSVDLSSVISETSTPCHCQHVQHWLKEVLRVILRIEDRIHQGCMNLTQDTSSSSADSIMQPAIEFPTTSEAIVEFFEMIKHDDSKRLDVVRCVAKEVCQKKKKSVRRVILRLSSPSAWKHFSKNGQRGKLSALNIGLPEFVVNCLNYSKVRSDIS